MAIGSFDPTVRAKCSWRSTTRPCIAIGDLDILSAERTPDQRQPDDAPESGTTHPWPGDELVSRVAGGLDKDAFYESGRQSVRDIEAALAIIGRQLDSYGEILDFGCGCGRILMWLDHLAATSNIHGVDVDGRAVRWAQEHLPWAHLKVNQPVPPLDYPDASFDLVYNHSVFTHLDEEQQDLWLAELRRVTKPGGNLLLSVHGLKPLVDFEEGSRNAGGDPAPVRAALRKRGIAFVDLDSHVGGPFQADYHSTFHAPWYVFDHWSRWFVIKAYIPQGSLGFQDFVLLERPEGDVAEDAGIAPFPLRGDAAHPPVEVGEPSLAAVQRAVANPLHGPAPEAPARYGALTSLVRKTVLRVLFHYTNYQRGVDRSILDALKELDAAVAGLTREMEQVRAAERVHGVLTLNESNVRLWDSLRRHGERINRLEEDLWEALAKKADRTAGRAGDPAIDDGDSG